MTERRVVVDHGGNPVAALGASLPFYSAALAPLGFVLLRNEKDVPIASPTTTATIAKRSATTHPIDGAWRSTSLASPGDRPHLAGQE